MSCAPQILTRSKSCPTVFYPTCTPTGSPTSAERNLPVATQILQRMGPLDLGSSSVQANTKLGLGSLQARQSAPLLQMQARTFAAVIAAGILAKAEESHDENSIFTIAAPAGEGERNTCSSAEALRSAIASSPSPAPSLDLDGGEKDLFRAIEAAKAEGANTRGIWIDLNEEGEPVAKHMPFIKKQADQPDMGSLIRKIQENRLARGFPLYTETELQNLSRLPGILECLAKR